MAQNGKGVAVRGSTGTNGGIGVLGQTANDRTVGVNAVNLAPGGTGLHASGKGLAAELDGGLEVHGPCAGCVGRPGFSLTPAGTQLTPVDDGNNVGKFVSATIGSDGLGLISYQDVTAKALKVAHCGDPSCTSATTTALATVVNGVAGFDTSVAVGADGLGIISYTATKLGQASFLDVAHCENLACSKATITQLDSQVGLGTSIMVGADGLPLISYQTLLSPQRLKFAHCSNAACTAAALHQPSVSGPAGGADVGAGSSLALAPFDLNMDGAPVVTFLDTTNDTLWATRCTDVECAHVTGATQLADGVDSASLTIADDGRALVAVGSETQQLRFVHCLTLNSCSTFDTTPVPFLLAGAVKVSLTIGPDGIPILLGSLPGSAILTLRCADPVCAGFGPVSVFPSGGSPSIALTMGADGLPLAAYYDPTGDALHVVHCSNVFCAPFFRRR